MKILFITVNFPGFGNGRSGGGLVALRLAKALLNKGVECFIFNGDTSKSEGPVMKQREWLGGLGWDICLSQLANGETLGSILQEICKNVRPDAVHIFQYECWKGWLLPALRKIGLPLVFTALDYGPFCARSTLVKGCGTLCEGRPDAPKCTSCLNSGRTPLVGIIRKVSNWLPESTQNLPGIGALAKDAVNNRHRMLEALRCWPAYLESIDQWIAPSLAMKAMLADNGVDTNKLNHVPYGFDMPEEKQAKIDADPFVFGFAGRPIYEKGFHLLTKAFRDLALCNEGVRLKLFMPQEQMSGLYARNSLSILKPVESKVVWGSFDGTDPQSISEAQAQVHAMVVPSIWLDNLPLVVVESLANGTAVIASSHSSASEPIVEGENGLLFDYFQVGSLCQVMSKFVKDYKSNSAKYAQVSYSKSADSEAQDIVDIYNKLY